MSFDKTILPENVLHLLYRDSLYFSSHVTTSPIDLPVEPGLPSLGKNDRLTTLCVSFDEDVFLPERHLDFIAKMLGACKMNIDDVAIVNLKTQNVSYLDIHRQFHPQTMILFGLTTADIKLPLDFPPLIIQAYNGCRYLQTPSLELLNQEASEAIPLKKQLWNCLKQLFPAES